MLIRRGTLPSNSFPHLTSLSSSWSWITLFKLWELTCFYETKTRWNCEEETLIFISQHQKRRLRMTDSLIRYSNTFAGIEQSQTKSEYNTFYWCLCWAQNRFSKWWSDKTGKQIKQQNLKYNHCSSSRNISKYQHKSATLQQIFASCNDYKVVMRNNGFRGAAINQCYGLSLQFEI